LPAQRPENVDQVPLLRMLQDVDLVWLRTIEAVGPRLAFGLVRGMGPRDWQISALFAALHLGRK
jgi:hypothetical protein